MNKRASYHCRGGRVRPPLRIRSASACGFAVCRSWAGVLWLLVILSLLVAGSTSAQRRLRYDPYVLPHRQARRSQAQNREAARPRQKPAHIMGSIDPAAVEILKKMFKPTMAYIGQQTTQVGGRTSVQQIEEDEKGRIRLQYQSPPDFRGDIMLILPGSFYEYHARQGKTDVALWPIQRGQREQGLLNLIRRGVVTVAQTGEEQILGRDCAIIAVSTPRPAGGQILQGKFWIDRETGIVMKRERWNAHGLISQSYLTSITVGAVIPPSDFLPRSLPRATTEALFPEGQPHFSTVEQAQLQTPFHILQPAQLPEGYALDAVWVFRGGTGSVLLRYTHGVNHFSLFERRILKPNPGQRLNAPRWAGGSVLHWQTTTPEGVLGIIYIGHLAPEEAQDLTQLR